MRYLSILFPCILLFSISAAGQSDFGTTAATFLTIDMGARARGMGSAFSSIADDASGAYWNPAGLGHLQHTIIDYSYSDLLTSFHFNDISFALHLNRWGALHLSYKSLNMDDMQVTIESQPNGTGEWYDSGSSVTGLSYGKIFWNSLSAGITAKYIKERIYSSDADAIAFDGGFIYTLPVYDVRFGLSFLNYGTSIKMKGINHQFSIDLDPNIYGNNDPINPDLITTEYDLPRLIRFGMSADLFRKMNNVSLIIALDGVRPKDEHIYYNLGAEFGFKDVLFIRHGFIDFFEQIVQEKLSCSGFGIRLPILDVVAVRFDYSIQEVSWLNGDQKMYSLGLELVNN
ncbi:PorV/PorQ family protein [candidate division KSB1 bacterium]|nr:PorV/PorQ family protein [candidate division KSB1 bacterium]